MPSRRSSLVSPQSVSASFAKGELAPSLYGRIDTAAYQIGLRTARNVIVHPYGGVSNRPGTRFIGPVISHSTPSRLIEFRFNTVDNYILEFSNLKMRVIRNDGHVIDSTKIITAITKANPAVVTAVAHGFSNGDEVSLSSVVGMTQLNGRRFIIAGVTADTFQLKDQVDGTTNINSTSYTTYVSGGTAGRIYTVVSPYAAADLLEIQSVQSADVMTFVHASYPIYELARTGHAAWTFTQLVLGPTITYPLDLVVVPTVAGTTSYSYKITSVDSDTGEESLAGLEKSRIMDGTNATLARPLSAITKAAAAVLTDTAPALWGFTQVGKSFYVSGVLGMTQINGHSYACTANANHTTTLAVNSTAFGTYTSGGTLKQAIQSVTKANPAVVTMNEHSLANGDEIYIENCAGMVELNGRRFTVTNVTANTFELLGIDSTAYTTYTENGLLYRTFQKITTGAVTANNTLTWTAISGADTYTVYKFDNGAFGKIGTTAANTFLDDNILADLSKGPPSSRNPFADGNNPGAVAYFEQRRAFGGTALNPDTSYYSQIGRYKNFNISSPLQADDAIQATLTSREINKIKFFVPLNDLLVLTEGGEWRVNSGPDSAFSPNTIKQKLQSTWGSGRLKPIIVGATVLYSEGNLARIRSLGYSFQDDGYLSTDLSQYSNHLVQANQIVDWCYTHAKDSRLYMPRDDGKLLTMTFDQTQEVVAWTRWDTKGTFERCASLKLTDVDGDAVYVVVKRKIGGRDVRYIEKVDSRAFTDLRDCYFVDCGLSYDVPVTVTGTTAASPVVVTAPGHGFSNGDTVIFSDILWTSTFDSVDNETQPDQLNNHQYLIKNTTGNTFELTNLSGTNIDGTAFTAYVSGGYVRKCVQTISGLDHLEGATVVGLADGNVVGGLTVSSGTVTLPAKAGRVHLGLKYVSDVETLDITIPYPNFSVLEREKKLVKVMVRFEKSRGLYVGPSSSQLLDIKWRTEEAADQPTGLLTGDHEIRVTPQWDTAGRVFMRQSNPLPMTILAVVGSWQVGT